MATTTTVFGYTKPAEGDLDWDTTLNDNFDLIDADLAAEHDADGTHGDVTVTTITVPNTGLHILDTDASHDLIIAPGSNLTADRTLTITTGDAARTITINGNPTLDDWFDQSVKTTASPTFDTLTVGNTGLIVGASTPFSDATGTLTLQNIDALDATTEATIEAAIDTLANLTSIQGQTITLSGALTVESASLVNQDLTSDASPTFASITLNNTGLHILDTDASHDLVIAPGSDLTADRTLTITTGDADRTITINGNPTLDDWFDQSVKTTASPTFAGLTLSGPHTLDAGQDLQEETADLASPSSGYRRLFARDSGGLATLDSDGNRHEVEFAGGRVLQVQLPQAITLTKAGTFSDSDIDADGFIGIDSTNGRLYFRHSGGTWEYVAATIDQAEVNLTSAANANGEATRYEEFSAEHTAADGTHGDITTDSITNDGPHDQQEETSDPASPAAGYRRLFARDSGGLVTLDSDGNRHEVEFAGGRILTAAIEPKPSFWQYQDGGTDEVHGTIRFEAGDNTLSTGTKAITFAQTFTELLDVFLISKTGANAMYPSALGTSGFTANGTGSDNFAWLAIGKD